jgi:hypothetical protein
MKLSKDRQVRLAVEELEVRCVLSYLVLDPVPPGTTYNIAGRNLPWTSPDGFVVQGQIRGGQRFNGPLGFPQAVLTDPHPPQQIDYPTLPESLALALRYPQWTFNRSNQTLADDSLQIKDYEAQLSPGPRAPAGAPPRLVGGSLAVHYNLNGVDPANIHWIQVATSDTPRGGGTVPPQVYVDKNPGYIFSNRSPGK